MIDEILATTIARARAAHLRAGLQRGPSEREERSTRLKSVLDSLPLGARQTTRQALEARIHPEALKTISRWHWGSGNVVLLGPTGTGKTSAAVWLVRRLVAQGVARGGDELEQAAAIRWQSCLDLSALAREWRHGTGMPEPVLRCQNARLLVLDDLGVDDDPKVLWRILSVRLEREWPTVITSGLTAYGANSLEAIFGDGLCRRLLECGGDKGTFVDLREKK